MFNFVTPWTEAHQASLSFTPPQSLLKLMSIESVMPSDHLILCHPLLLVPSILLSISSVQSLSHVWLFATPWTAAHQASCPSPTPEVYPNSCPLSWWCHPTILSSVVPFSSCLESFPASGSFPMSQLFASCGQGIGVSASASGLPVNIQSWFPLRLTGLISL